MLIKEYTERLNIKQDIFNQFHMMDTAYFDIETTGFDKDEDSIILISLGWFKNCNELTLKQYFAENLQEEEEILYSFGSDLVRYNKWCSYNGIAFDEPFIKNRMERHNINFDSPEEHVDLYRLIRPYYKQLGIERCNLKSVEKHIGINRADAIDGGISVDLYKKFLITSDEELRNIIMLHNYEDVLNLPKIHEFTYKVVNSKDLVREDRITEKQLKYLTILLNKNNLQLNVDLGKVSKKAASRIIDHILKGCMDSNELKCIVDNSY